MATFTGGWAHGARHGTGRQVEPDGSEYVGQWHRGMREGEGEQTGVGGGVYRGQFLADQRHGQGALMRPNLPGGRRQARTRGLRRTFGCSSERKRLTCDVRVSQPSRANLRWASSEARES